MAGYNKISDYFDYVELDQEAAIREREISQSN